MGWVIKALLILLAYLLGSIPVGLILSRLKGIDIRTVGSGNIGATNVFRSVGKTWGIATFIGDALKGFLPAWLFPLLVTRGAAGLGLACGCAAIAGHNWPVYLGFKGGKGVATSAGVLLGVAPAAVAIGFVAWVVLFLTTRFVSVASIGAALVVPTTAWTMYSQRGALLPLVLTVLGLVVIWRHRSNIRRLIDGEEHQFVFRRKPTKDTNVHEKD